MLLDFVSLLEKIKTRKKLASDFFEENAKGVQKRARVNYNISVYQIVRFAEKRRKKSRRNFVYFASPNPTQKIINI